VLCPSSDEVTLIGWGELEDELSCPVGAVVEAVADGPPEEEHAASSTRSVARHGPLADGLVATGRDALSVESRPLMDV
jgi:hypothetical protein